MRKSSRGRHGGWRLNLLLSPSSRSVMHYLRGVAWFWQNTSRWSSSVVGICQLARRRRILSPKSARDSFNGRSCLTVVVYVVAATSGTHQNTSNNCLFCWLPSRIFILPHSAGSSKSYLLLDLGCYVLDLLLTAAACSIHGSCPK